MGQHRLVGVDRAGADGRLTLSRPTCAVKGPSPTSWYATCRPSFAAYRVSGGPTVARSPSSAMEAGSGQAGGT